MLPFKMGMGLVVLGAVLGSLLPGRNGIIWLIPPALAFSAVMGVTGISPGFVLIVSSIVATGSGLTLFVESRIRKLYPRGRSAEISGEILGMSASFLLFSVVFGVIGGPLAWCILVGIRRKCDFKAMLGFSALAVAMGFVRFITAFTAGVVVLGKVLRL